MQESLMLLYEEELKGEGYDILTARNGREAIRRLETGKPDLIILDIVMPVMDGMEALGRIVSKEKSPSSSTPLIRGLAGVSSWAADAYVTKSHDLSKLKKKIRELLEKGKGQ